jgi:hypothetical protein
VAILLTAVLLSGVPTWNSGSFRISFASCEYPLLGSSRSDKVERGKVELVDSITDDDVYELDVNVLNEELADEDVAFWILGCDEVR